MLQFMGLQRVGQDLATEQQEILSFKYSRKEKLILKVFYHTIFIPEDTDGFIYWG